MWGINTWMGLSIFKADTNFPSMICKLKKRSRKTIIQARLEINNSNRILHRNQRRGVKMLRQGEISCPARFTVVGIPNPARKGGSNLMIRGLLIQEHRTSGISHRCGSDTFC